MNTPSFFNEISGRDAWGTIRGYVYQVDLTILRWMELEENDSLELECGEDIDIVHRDLQKQELSRELEQLKVREYNLSLNQKVVLEILKNFYTHKVNNPGQNLTFRFVTNTAYGREQTALFARGEKGIDAWIRLSANPVIDPADPTLAVIDEQGIACLNPPNPPSPTIPRQPHLQTLKCPVTFVLISPAVKSKMYFCIQK